MYILRISKKAFIRLEENGDTTIVSVPERATKFETIGDAMRAAVQVNEDFEEDIVTAVPL
jgi:hypothetical protein|nr:MAG TPA: hypothetical protein [Caudoviricetes sp.]